MKKRNSLNLFDGEDDDVHLHQVPMKKQKRMVSLTLFDDLLDYHEQASPPSNILLPLPSPPRAPVFLFGVCISSHNIHPKSYTLAIVPYSGQDMAESAGNIVHRRRELNGKEKVTRIDQRVEKNQPEPCPELLPPRVLQQIEWSGGTPPIFLFWKRLTVSDVKKQENRLFLSRKESPMKKLMEFLTKGEQIEVEGDGLQVLTIDPKGDNYILQLKQWPSLPMFVLKKQWSKLVKENQLAKDDWIQLWGYRLNSQFHLAVNFKKAEKDRTQSNGASSSNVEGRGGTGSGCGSSIISQA